MSNPIIVHDQPADDPAVARSEMSHYRTILQAALLSSRKRTARRFDKYSAVQAGVEVLFLAAWAFVVVLIATGVR